METTDWPWIPVNSHNGPAMSNFDGVRPQLLQNQISLKHYHIGTETKWPPFWQATFLDTFFNGNIWISIEISLKFVPKGQISNIPALVQIMAWRRPGDKPFSEPMLVSLPTHICVTRPQWVKQATNGLFCVISKYQAMLYISITVLFAASYYDWP